jgi:putative transposon-encoded protein
MSLYELKNRNLFAATNKRKFVKFEFYGKEMVEKDVRASGNSGKIYLPPEWVGCKVKIVKID